MFPNVSEDVAVSQGLANHDSRAQLTVTGSFLALFKCARAHFDPVKSWPEEFATLGLQRPSNCSYFVSPLAVHCDIKEAKGHLTEGVNPYSFFVELRPDSQCSEGF